jgi:Fe2+ or Zn2+ uptake regulation protein
MKNRSKEILKIAEEIRRYLNTHPNATDTAEGVMHWLDRQRYEDTLELVKKALLFLEDKGVVRQAPQLDGRITFKSTETL